MSLVGKLLPGPDLLGVVRRIAETGPVPVTPEKRLCQNFRWKRSCSACSDVCPVEAIDPGTLKIDGARCVGCGVCALVCPAGALAFEGRPRASVLADIEAALGRGDVVRFTCDRSGGAFGRSKRLKGSVVVPCLSMLDEALLLGCYARGARDVRLLGCSPRCAFVKGRRIHQDTLRVAGALRLALRLRHGAGRATPDGAPAGARGREIQSAEGDEGPQGHGRREFLVRAGRELLRAAYPAPGGGDKPGGWTWLHRLPERRAELLGMINGQAAGKHGLRRSGGLQFADIRADRGRCSMCGVCGALCPTGAVGTVELDRSTLLYFRSGWCTACLLCVRACPEGALSVEGSVELGRLAGSGEVLLKLPAAICPACRGRHIPERTKGECPSCRKDDPRLGPSRNARAR